MGIFGPSSQEKLRSHPIVAAADWRRHMDHRVPEYDELIASALQLAGRREDDVDVAAMRRRAHRAAEAVLKHLCTKLRSMSWPDLQIVLNRPDFSSALLSDYLSTCGASGAAINDELAPLMNRLLPEGLADEVRKGSFDQDTDDPAHLARILGSAGATPVAGDATVTLPDPGLTEHDLRQLAYRAFSAFGMTLLSFANLKLEQLTRLLLQHAPVFGDTIVRPSGFGSPAGHDDSLWIGFEGPHGSVIAYFASSDGDFVNTNVLMPMSALPPPAKWGIGTLGARVPAEVAHILDDARVVPLWELSAFADQRPAAELEVPVQLAADLVDDGWETDGDGGFKTDVVVAPGQTLAVFFGAYYTASFGLMTPIDKDEYVPAEMRARSFGRYQLDVVAEMAVLCQRYPAQGPVPSAQALTADAKALATYTHQQFAGPQPSTPPPAAAPAPVMVPDPDSSARTQPTTPPGYPAHPEATTAAPTTPPIQHASHGSSPSGQHGTAAPSISTIGGSAGTTPTSRRGVLIAIAAGVAVATIGTIAVLMNTGSGNTPSATSAITLTPDRKPVARESDRWPSPTPTRTASTGARPPATNVALNVSAPIAQPACDGTGIVVLGSAINPGRYDAEIQRFLDAFPGASYLRTDHTCPSLRQSTAVGNPIYAVYRPAGRTHEEVCAAVRAAGGDAYGKWLDATTDPAYMIRC